MVTRCVAYVVEIVVLATGAYTFLRTRRAFIVAGLKAGKQVLELHHTRVNEHQRRVVARHKRAGRHNRMPLFFKVIQKCRTNIVKRLHGMDPGRLGDRFHISP